MPKPLPDAKRRKILADVRAGMARNEIARSQKVSPSTVTKVARQAGITDAFDRTKTQEATRAAALDAKALRAQLKMDLLGDAQRFRERAWSPYEVVVNTPQGAEVLELALPPLTEARAAYTAIGIAVDKTVAIEKHDTQDDGSGHAKSVLGKLFTGLAQAVADEIPETPQDGD